MSTTAELIAQLEHSDAGRRRQAALALGSSGDETAAPALVARLGSEANSCVREDLTWATVQMIHATLPAVLAMLVAITIAFSMACFLASIFGKSSLSTVKLIEEI